MFKNATIYQFEAKNGLDPAALANELDKFPFHPTSPTQVLSTGWVPPDNDAPDEIAARPLSGHVFVRFAIETRSVPTAAIKKRADELAAKVEETTGRKPGKKERRDLKEDALQELLPRAFPKLVHIPVWIDLDRKRLVIDSANQSQVDLLITAMVLALAPLAPPDELSITVLHTERPAHHLMREWLIQGEADGQFELGRAAELQADDESAARVKYEDHTLDIDEVKQHVRTGKSPVSVELSFCGRVSFTLTDALRLKGLAFLDAVFEGRADADKAFAADMALMTGELRPLIDELVHQLS